MKKAIHHSLYLFCLTALLFTNSCKKDSTQTVVYNLQTYDAGDFYFSGSTNEGDFNISAFDVQQAFATVGLTYDVSKVNTAKLNSLRATTNSNFNDIQSIIVYIKTQGAGGYGVEVARISAFGSGATSADFVLNGVELKQYLGSSSTVTVVVQSKSSASSFTEISVSGGVIKAEVKK